jgi:3-deoxy-D-manno-octulosonic-acid transferase
VVAFPNGHHAKVPRGPVGAAGTGPVSRGSCKPPADLDPCRLGGRSAGREPPGQELDAALPEHFVAVSTTTRTGQALARERFGADRVFYCPLDLPWAVEPIPECAPAPLLILAETEFWPNLLSGCFRRGIPVAVVNARISDRSWPRYRRLRWLWRPFLEPLSRVLAQSETDAERLKAIGCLPQRSRSPAT